MVGFVYAAGDNFGLPWLLEIVTVPFLLWFIVRKFPGPIVKKMMNGRQEQIRASLAAGEEAKAEIEAVLVQRQAELEAAHGESSTILEQARRSAEQVAADGDRRAEEEYERLVQSAHASVEMERARVRDEISTSLGAVVLDAAREVIDAELNPANHRRLIGEAISAAETGA
jgi:F-type H+-transporting ATPase subunit b